MGDAVRTVGQLKIIAALFTVAKIQKQSKYPSTNEWIKKMCSTYVWNTTQHKKEWNNAVYSKMDGPRVYQTKWNKSEEKDKYHMMLLKCGI